MEQEVSPISLNRHVLHSLNQESNPLVPAVVVGQCQRLLRSLFRIEWVKTLPETNLYITLRMFFQDIDHNRSIILDVRAESDIDRFHRARTHHLHHDGRNHGDSMHNIHCRYQFYVNLRKTFESTTIPTEAKWQIRLLLASPRIFSGANMPVLPPASEKSDTAGAISPFLHPIILKILP